MIGCAIQEKGSGSSTGGSDGSADGAADGADGAAANTPPGAATVVLSPERPTTLDDVRVVIVADAADPDGDAVSYQTLWFEDGVLRDDLTGDTLPATETAKGEVWTVSVAANDGLADGGVAEAEATIVNSLPTATAALPAAVDSRADLELVVTGEDADGDEVSFAVTWAVDGGVTPWVDTVVPASATARGEVWMATVTPNDGEDDGAPVVATVRIENAAPTVDGVSLSPSPAFEGSRVVATSSGAADIDGDALSFGYTWLVNGAAVSGVSGDSLTGAHFDKGDLVRVRLQVGDGGDLSGEVESDALTISNTLPSGSGVAINPSVVTKGATASCVPAGWSDGDGDAEAWRYSWQVNAVASGTGSGLTGASFNKGDSLVCVATPDDGEGLGSPLTSSAVVVANTAPTLASATLSTLSPTESDTLSVILGATSDADGDPVSVSYAWSVNGTLVSTSPTLGASLFARGDTVQVTVTPHDGTVAGAAVHSGTATVANSAPTVGTVSLSPALVYTNGTLTATAAGADLDGDPVTLSYAWSVNGATVGATGSSLSGALYFDKGDVVQVTVTPGDGLTTGASRSSSGVTVQNSAPTAPVVAVSPTEPVEGEALVCEVLTDATDDDGDALSYTFVWDVDGAPYAGAGETVHPGDTVVSGATFADELWICTAVADDGSASGPAADDAVMVESACGDGSVTLTASGIEFVTVCGGTFDMGCTPGQSSCRSDESPVLMTTLTNDYYLGRTEVTQGQFQALMGYNPSNFLSCGLTCPVETLSWHEAAAFANAVSAAAGLESCYSCTGSGSSVSCAAPADPYACAGYRLPTEAEWEGAARCGTDLLYAGSNSIDAVAWYLSNSGSSTHPVAGLTPNACGLYDMSGNVFEWANDWYGAYASGAVSDPSGPASGSSRVFRGGNWGNFALISRVASRASLPPHYRFSSQGFRLLRTAD